MKTQQLQKMFFCFEQGRETSVPPCTLLHLSEHGEASVIYGVTKSWEVAKEEKEYFSFHTVARDGSKYTIMQPLDWN